MVGCETNGLLSPALSSTGGEGEGFAKFIGFNAALFVVPILFTSATVFAPIPEATLRSGPTPGLPQGEGTAILRLS